MNDLLFTSLSNLRETTFYDVSNEILEIFRMSSEKYFMDFIILQYFRFDVPFRKT